MRCSSGRWPPTPSKRSSGQRDIAGQHRLLLDCDNTQLDNDPACRTISETILPSNSDRRAGTGTGRSFEQLRAELGYADYLGALQRYRLGDVNDPRLPLVSSFLVESVCQPVVSRRARRSSGIFELGARRRSLRMATWYFSRAGSSARGCGRQPFTIGLRYRSARYDIVVENPRGAGRGVSALELARWRGVRRPERHSAR